MSSYKIVAALWEDHTVFQNAPIPKTLDGLIRPSLTVGILYKETDRHIVLISHIERFDERDQCDFIIIFKDSLVGPLKEYGEIELKKLRNREGCK